MKTIAQSILIKEFEEKYPLFVCTPYHDDMVNVNMGGGSTCCTSINARNVDMFDHEHKRLEIKKQWESKYPYLYFHIGSDYKPHAIWVKRNDRDAEAITYTIQGDPPYMQDIMLQHYNLEAKKALQPDWFFCSGCNEAKPKTEYSYFHFAGNYCQQCKEEDPEAYRRAMNETYE